nr:hypothetical protein [Methylomarinum sp. Ch1-1]MDP4522939.1 hypothetical protein [Methylomarinum sp. Ch1-1]
MNTKLMFYVKKTIDQWVLITTTVFLLGYFLFPTTSKQNTFFYIGVCPAVVLLAFFYFKQLEIPNWIIVSTVVFAAYLFLNSTWSIHYSNEQTLTYLRYLFTTYCLIGAIFLFNIKGKITPLFYLKH